MMKTLKSTIASTLRTLKELSVNSPIMTHSQDVISISSIRKDSKSIIANLRRSSIGSVHRNPSTSSKIKFMVAKSSTSAVSGNSALKKCKPTAPKLAGKNSATTTVVSNSARSGTHTLRMKTTTGCGTSKSAP